MLLISSFTLVPNIPLQRVQLTKQGHAITKNPMVQHCGKRPHFLYFSNEKFLMAEGGGGGCPTASRNAQSQHPCGTQVKGAWAAGRLQGTGQELLCPCEALHDKI